MSLKTPKWRFLTPGINCVSIPVIELPATNRRQVLTMADIHRIVPPRHRSQGSGLRVGRVRAHVLSSSRGIRIDVPVLSVSWSFEDHSVIIQALRKGLIEHEASDTRGVPRWKSSCPDRLAEATISTIVASVRRSGQEDVQRGTPQIDISRNSVGGVWRRNWAAAVGYSKLGRYSE